MTTCIAVYTSWTTGNDESWRIFDHPEELTERGTVGRMLESFIKAGVKSPVILYPAPTHPAIEKHVQELAKPYDVDVHVFTGEELSGAVRALKSHGFPDEFDDVWDIANYGRYRNWKLLYAALKGYDNVLLIDDDELIEKPGYIRICERDIGTKVRGTTVLAKTGCYLDEKGNKYYDGQVAAFDRWPKDRLFNEAVKHALGAPERLSPCEVAFGGNTMINHKMFLAVPYDINIPRGEDDDFVMNAKHRGYDVFFDKDMTVRHLPPPRRRLFWTRMRQDIKRFKYLREKARIFGRNPKDLNVFFEYFLQEDLEHKAVSGSLDAAKRYLDADREEALEFLNNALVATEPNRDPLRGLVEKQLRFMDAWAKVLPKVEGLWA